MSRPTPRRLRVLLNDLPVGLLTQDDTSRCVFRLQASYLAQSPRPVLGQVFEDDPGRVLLARSRLPAWFANLLPEGALRELLERDLGDREFRLLHALGADLPGAVRVVEDESDDPRDPAADVADQHDAEQDGAGTGDAWHFSLAGVQLKFSAVRTGRGMTVPVSGQGGDWILKLPDLRYPEVPANEHATMAWARACGIEVPETGLVELADVSGLPHIGIPRGEARAFMIRRFDRPAPGQRLHMEDFAQVLDLYPARKYERFNIETIARVTLALAGEAALVELVRRVVFMVASGNGDAHHKNWALVYPDGMRAALSPAYDLVSTIQYMSDDSMALNFGGSKRWQDVGLDTFRRLARKTDIDEARMLNWVEQAVTVTRQAWHSSAGEFGYTQAQQDRLAQHMRSVPLLAAAYVRANV